jgi:hypothetical protein
MANLTLAIPADLKGEMKKFAEINWSEVARQTIVEKIQTLEAMDRLLTKSTLTERQRPTKSAGRSDGACGRNTDSPPRWS